MVWIHGGAFVDGSGLEYGPDFFMDEDVILVTLNYRLGVLGFLNTEDGHMPANNGLKDMILALKWVRRNIASFGGNPDRVTIFGQSAGGAAVNHLMLSPTAKGLFHGVIAQSGSSFVPWSLTLHPRESAMELAKRVSCGVQSTHEMVTCLKELDLEVLLSHSLDVPEGVSGLAVSSSMTWRLMCLFCSII